MQVRTCPGDTACCPGRPLRTQDGHWCLRPGHCEPQGGSSWPNPDSPVTGALRRRELSTRRGQHVAGSGVPGNRPGLCQHIVVAVGASSPQSGQGSAPRLVVCGLQFSIVGRDRKHFVCGGRSHWVSASPWVSLWGALDSWDLPAHPRPPGLCTAYICSTHLLGEGGAGVCSSWGGRARGLEGAGTAR